MIRQAYYAFIILPMLVSGCSRGNDAPQAAGTGAGDVIAVKAAPAEQRVFPRRIEIVGTLAPEDEVVVSSEVEGILDRITVDLGSVVRQGDVIAQINQREFELQLEQTQAALAQARLRLGLRPGESDEVSPEDTTIVRQARAVLDDARAKYESAKKLFATGDMAELRYIEAQENFKAREAAYLGAIENVRDQLAGLSRLRAQVELAQKKLTDTTILSPLAGSVSMKHSSAGEYVKIGTPVVTLVRLDPLRLRGDVPEPYAASVYQGLSLTFTVDALRDRSFEGRITRLSPAVSPGTRSLTIEAEIGNRNGQLRPGYFARAQIVVDPDAKAVMVPQSAVVTYVGIVKVFVVEGDRVVERQVKLGTRMDGFVEISEGVKIGDLVVTENAQVLYNGARVSVET